MTTATDRVFQDMLNEYITDGLLESMAIKRDYFFNTVEKDPNWKGGKIPVPFRGGDASSVEMGQLVGETDISDNQYIRGSIDGYQEVWGAMQFRHKDILDHSGKLNEDSFLSNLPGQLDDFMKYMKMVISIQIMTGPHFAKAVVNATEGADGALGKIKVNRIDRFTLKQKCTLDDDNTGQVDVYVIAIDVNAEKVTLSATRTGAALDVSAYTVAQNAKFYTPGILEAGVATNKFLSVKDCLSPATNPFTNVATGAQATLHGKTKLSYPFLQAVCIDGSTVSATNIIEKVFDGYTRVRILGKGNATEVICSLKHLGSMMKLIETQKGGFKVVEGSNKANIYGWTEITILSTAGTTLKFVGIQEMDDDVLFYMDWKAFVFRSNGLFRKRTAPDGKQYYEKRAQTGFVYIVDISLFGELECRMPGACGIMLDIPNYA